VDTTATIVDTIRVGPFDPAHKTVVVSGRLIGTLAANGVYTPDLAGNGNGGETVTSQFVIKKVDGQNRIDSLRNGLLLTSGQFQVAYRQYALYFYDASERYLVPEPRYGPGPSVESQQTAQWLVKNLVLGPRTELQNAETNLEFPAQADANRVQIKVGTPTTIEVPGASQLDGAHRNRLAAQLATTLDQVLSGGAMIITDNHKPITVPAAHGSSFSESSLDIKVDADPVSPPRVFYLNRGGIYDEQGRKLRGALGDGSYGLSSVAVAEGTSSRDLLVAGTTGAGDSRRLLIGTVNRGLHTTRIVGPLSRPSWVNGTSEVWIASGAKVYRVTTDGAYQAVALLGLPANATISALRTSPDGTRVALVVNNRGVSQVYVGTVTRDAEQVHVEAAMPITPVGFAPVDVAWNDILKLFMIGTIGATSQVVEVQADGSLWTTHGLGNLADPPDSITIAESQPAWVSTNGAVWKQNGPIWISPTGAGTTFGTNPVYLE
jgi:hypothetical protein